MATTDELTRSYRQQTLALRAATLRDLQRLWPALNWDDLERSFPAWLTTVATLVQRDRARASGLASAYVKAHRAAAGVSGAVAVDLAGAAPAEQVETSLRVTTLVAARKALEAGQTTQQAKATTFVQSSGAATRLVLDAGRDTIAHTTMRDPRTRGWRRVTAGGCSFCRTLAGRGAVYTESSSTFRSHDHCVCSAEPVYS